MAVRLASEVGYRVPHLCEAAMLHDIGRMAMLGLTDHPQGLTERQRCVVRLHVLIGAQVAETVGLPREAVDAVRYHHERWDGEGYPDGLRGHEIPEGARVLAVADAVVSMLERREYEGERTLDEVVAELKACSGKQFDPLVAEAAVRLIESFEIYRLIASGELR